MTDFDARIAALEKKIVDLRPRMEATQGNWLDLAGPWLGAFWQAKADETVKGDPERTNSIDKTDLQTLKGRVNSLVANARTEAEKVLVSGSDGTELWPHLDPELQPGPDVPYVSGQFTIFRIFDIKTDTERPSGPYDFRPYMEKALKLAEPMLTEAGYTPRMVVHSGIGMVGGKPYVWTQEMTDAMNRYADLHDEMLGAQRDLAAVIREKKETEAKSRWDEV